MIGPWRVPGIMSASLRDHCGSVDRHRRIVDDGRGYYAVAGGEIRRQAAGDPEADAAAAAGANGEPQQIGRLTAAAEDKHAGARCNTRFKGKPDQSNHRAFRQIGEFKRVLRIG
jgi:hypothetical protein